MKKQATTPFIAEIKDSLGVTVLQISYLDKDKILLAKWYNHLGPGEVIKGVKAVVESLSKYKCSRLLNDKSESSGDWQEANEWIEYEGAPNAYDAGLRHIAYVLSQEIYNLLSSRDLDRRISNEFNMQLFHAQEAAREWLRSQSDQF